jgi:hypothetical protein
MTAVTAADSLTDRRSIPGTGARIWNVVRVHYANRFTMFALPWIVFGFIFVVNLVIWISIFASTHEQLTGTQWSGATFYIYVYFAVAAVQAMNLTFRFALGLSVTRRDYYLGTVLAFLIQGAILTLLCTILSYIEDWTNGYGMGAHMFSNMYFGTGSLGVRLFSCFGAFLFCFALGALSGSVFVRWRANGLYALGAIVAVLAVAFIAITTLTDSWPSVGAWFLQVRAVGVIAWFLIPTVIAGVAGFFVLRKAAARE